jgi:hypothetical protein
MSETSRDHQNQQIKNEINKEEIFVWASHNNHAAAEDEWEPQI